MKSLVIVLMLAVFFLFTPRTSEAITTGLPFGGLVNISIPCTCSAGTWIYYTPLYLGKPVPTTGALWFPPGARLYAWFELGVPATWDLGSYVPGTAAEACWITAPDPADPCIVLPAEGTIEFMGTSKSL